MESKQALREVDPFSLPVGLKVGQWRVNGWRGRGAYGTLYRVEREGRAEEGEFALKMAIHSGDERFGREAELLRRIASPYVPRFHEQGVWEHPAGAFPYIVMQLVEGEPLYEWAARRNPTSRQVLRLLGQVARALEATHAAGGVHRDVKGANVLVRAGDGRAFLTDFGAGYYRGAATLTSKLLAPGTPAYRSPEAWAFLNAFQRHPTAHYRASACDDLFALGGLAYRLVTDEYPPTQPGENGSRMWREGEPDVRPPRELNPQVSPALEAIISRLLAIAAVERFGGKAHEAAEALEQAMEREGSEGEVPLFGWSAEQGPRLRSSRTARLHAERDAAAREAHAQREEHERRRAQMGRAQALLRSLAPRWRAAVGAGLSGMLLVGLAAAVRFDGQDEAESASDSKARQGGRVAVGDSTNSTPVGATPPLAGDKKRGVTLPLPEQPLPGQNRPPCKRSGEVEIRGGCWHRLADSLKPPCKEEGKEEAYSWNGACYGPTYPAGREPTSSPP